MLEIGHGCPGGVEDLSPLDSREDQLGPAIGRIGLAFEVTEALEFVDEFRAGRQTELGLRRQVGQSNAVGSDVPPYLKVREPDVAETAVRPGAVEEFGPELKEEPAEDLTYSEPVTREAS